MIDALGIYSEDAEKLGPHVSWTKTKFLYVDDGPILPPLQLGNDTFEPVKSFVFLGCTVTNNGDLQQEIFRRRALAASTLQPLWQPFWRHQTISCKTKLRIFNSAILPFCFMAQNLGP